MQLVVSLGLLFLISCGSKGPLMFDLMPAPSAYADTGLALDKKVDESDIVPLTSEPIFYATDRLPKGAEDKGSSAYLSKRGGVVRVGRAKITPGKSGLTWTDVRKHSLLKNRSGKFPIKVESVDEYGLLASTLDSFSKANSEEKSGAAKAEARYFQEIDNKLRKSKKKIINIYIHGYKVTFDNPVLATAELWHFLGYDGVFVAYSWPATPKSLAYIADTQTADASARHLRKFIRLLGEKTSVEKINIVAYSAGTRVLSRALADLALEEKGNSRSAIRSKLKLGTTVLLAGDVDVGILAGHLSDGILSVSDQLIVYQSDSDSALSISRLISSFNRIGQSLEVDKMRPGVVDFLRKNPRLSIVDVSDADSAREGNGHGYLRKSPWVSSDLLLSLAYGLSPESRGLVQKKEGVPVWTFPPDYIDRLRGVLIKQRPDLRVRLDN